MATASFIPSERGDYEKRKGISLKDLVETTTSSNLPANGRSFGREITNLSETNEILSKAVTKNYLPANRLIDNKPPRASIEKVSSITYASDKLNQQNPQYVVPYVEEIFDYLRTEESKYLCNSDYFSTVQEDVNEKMRAILVDWLVDVHIKFKLVPETLFLAVNILDRYLSLVSIPRQKLQVVGVASMLIASKYEEIYPPEVKDFAYVTDKAYTCKEILEIEGKIISCLGFKFTHTSSLRFFQRFADIANLDERGRCIARYILELILVDYPMARYQSSLIACSAIYLVHKLQKKEAWNEALEKVSKYQESQLRGCAKEMYLLIQGAWKSNLQAIRKKFSTPKYLEVGKIQLDTV